MLRKILGYFSSSAPQYDSELSNIKTGESVSDAGSDEMNTTNSNGFDGAVDMRSMSKKQKKKELKRQKKERKRQKKLWKREQGKQSRDALNSSRLGTTMDSSAVGEDVSPGMEAEVGKKGSTRSSPRSNGVSGYLREENDQEQAGPVEEEKIARSQNGAGSSKNTKKKRKNEEANGDATDHTQQVAEPMDFEMESRDISPAINKGRSAESKEAKGKKAKKSRKSESEVEILPQPIYEVSESVVSKAQEQPRNLNQRKIKKARRKQRLALQSQSPDNGASDKDMPSARLHQPHTLTPHDISRSQSIFEQEVSAGEVAIQNDAELLEAEEAARERPKRLSKKALGKRKASDTAMASTSKRKRTKEEVAGASNLTSNGFSSSHVTPVANVVRPSSRSHSISSQSRADLADMAAQLYAEGMEYERHSPALSDASSLGPPPSNNRLRSSQQRVLTPMVKPKYPARPVSDHDSTSERDPYELPPSSQPKQPPSKSESEFESKSISGSESDSSTEPPVHAPPSESESEFESKSISGSESDSSTEPPVHAPPSSERQKRRLPAGKPESSPVKSTQRRKVPDVKRIAAKKNETGTPKASATAQSTPISKGSRLAAHVSQAIYDAVESYREENGLEQTELNAIIQADATRGRNKELWAYIHDLVPGVPGVKLLSHCRRKFHNFEARGSWTKEQDQDLRDAYERHPGKWKQIGAELNRFAEDCRDRWRNYLVCGDMQRKDPWDRDEENKFRGIVEEVVENMKTDKELKRSMSHKGLTDIYSLVDWQEISARMGHTRSRLQLLNKWKNLQKRAKEDSDDSDAQNPIAHAGWRLEEAELDAQAMSPGTKRQILYQIRDSQAGTEKKIPWIKIQKALGTSGRRMAFKVAFRKMKEQLQDHVGMKLQDIVSALIELNEEPENSDGTKSSARGGKHKRKSVLMSAEDVGEGPSTITKKVEKKSSSTRRDKGNGEGSSTQKARQSQATKTAMMAEMEDYRGEMPAVKTPKKLRSRMKINDQADSQETTTGGPSDVGGEDIGAAFQAVKSSQAKRKSPVLKAKKPITKAKKSKRPLSAYRVVESDDEDPAFTEQSNPEPARELAVQPEHGFRYNEGQQQDENEELDDDVQQFENPRSHLDVPEIPESDHGIASQPLAGQNGNAKMMYEDDDEDEENDFSHISHESLDLDMPPSTTANGFHNAKPGHTGSDEESVDLRPGREESVDLDTPYKQPVHPMTHFEEDGDYEAGLDLNGSKARYVRSTSISSDASSIPAVVHKKPGRSR